MPTGSSTHSSASRLKACLALLVLWSAAPLLQADVRIFTNSGNWSVADNWTNATKPIAGDDVVINGGGCTLDETIPNLRHLTINAGMRLTNQFGQGNATSVYSGDKILLTGDLTVNGIFAVLPMTNVFTLTGTISVDAGSTNMTGSGTAFLSEVRTGDVLRIDGYTNNIRAIFSDTALALEAAPTNSVAGGTAYMVSGRGMTIQAANITVGAGGQIFGYGLGFGALQGPYPAPEGDYGTSHGGYGGKKHPLYGNAYQPTSVGNGGSDAAGGGAVRLVAADTLTVNGSINMNVASAYGAGAGGSIWIQCGTLAGTNSIQARGDNQINSRYSGGGRIAVEFTNTTFTGWFSTGLGGDSGSPAGTFGTFVFPRNLNLSLQVTHSFTYGHSTSNLLSVSGMALPASEWAVDDLIVTNSGILFCQGDPLEINSASGGTNGNPHGQGVTINARNVKVYSGCSISACYHGFYGAYTGPGAQSSAGAAHGGRNGGTGNIYGSPTQPTALGSSGSGTGSGAIRLCVSNNLLVDGTIDARGSADTYSGSGGSIWIETDTLTGNGTINATANWADTRFPRPGGGRISITARDNNFSVTSLVTCLNYYTDQLSDGTIVYAPIAGESGAPGTIRTNRVVRTGSRARLSFAIRNQSIINGTDQSSATITLTNFQYSLNGADWYAPSNADQSASLIGFTDANSGATNWGNPTNTFTFVTRHADVVPTIGLDPFYVRFKAQSAIAQTNNTSGTNYLATGWWTTSERIPKPSIGTVITSW